MTVVGVGADGWDGLSPRAQRAVREAEVLIGSQRQLDLIPAMAGERVRWPSPMLPALPGLLKEHGDQAICVLASGDPMFYGVGATLVRLVGAGQVTVLPHPSSLSLACARLGWSVDEVEVVTAVARPLAALHPVIQPGQKILVLSADGRTPAEIASLLTARGYADSPMWILEQLGGGNERAVETTAGSWREPTDNLNVVAIDCAAGPILPRTPGLPDDAYENDGQLTKREIRAITLAQLAPVPGQLLWDVGAGAGSVAIEWMRHHRSCRAVAVERDTERAERIARNATALGVPGLAVVTGTAPQALHNLDRPDAVFVGGGATIAGVIEICWQALLPGGRLVVNAVTVESEAVVAQWHRRLGGELVRVAINRAAPLGGFTGWRPMLPVTQWAVTKERLT